MKPSRRRLLVAGLLAAPVLAALLGGGCAAVVVPPPTPADPVRVLLVDYGRHSSLVLPRPDGSAVEFAYGEWGWFAENRIQWYRAPAVLLWPTPGALGRRELPGPDGIALFRRREPREEEFAIPVAEARAGRLRESLEALHAAGRAQALFNPTFGLEFVPHPTSYWLGRNCNHLTAAWLEELGCTVKGCRLFSSWRIAAPAAGPGGGR